MESVRTVQMDGCRIDAHDRAEAPEAAMITVVKRRYMRVESKLKEKRSLEKGFTG